MKAKRVSEGGHFHRLKFKMKDSAQAADSGSSCGTSSPWEPVKLQTKPNKP